MIVNVTVSDTTIDGPHGPLLLRIYTPDRPHGPALVWVHGGAYAFGDVSMPESDWVSRQLAERGVAVIAVDYRLSPTIDLTDASVAPSGDGVHFPVASEEVVAAFHWMLAHANQLGADPEQLFLGGGSAGANLALSAMLRLRDGGEQHPRAGLLVYPSVHAVVPPLTRELEAGLGDLPPILRFSSEVMRVIHLNYVGDEAELANPYAFPGGHDLRGLPPVFILNSDNDPLRASGEALAGELAAAGVDTLVMREVGTRHGHLNSPDEPLALRSIDRMAAWVHGGPFLGVRHEASRT